MAISASPLPVARPRPGLLQNLSPDELQARDNERYKQAREAEDGVGEDVLPELTSYIRSKFDMMRGHRSSAGGWNERLLHAMRTFNREYNPAKLAQIREFGGSDVYAGVTATKCRGATSILREIYLNADRPWGLDPTPEPTLPDDIQGAIKQLVTAEMQVSLQEGQPFDPAAVRDRVKELTEAAHLATQAKASEEAKRAETRLDDLLVEGGFYEALAQCLVDVPIFPFVCLKGPVVRVVPVVKWVPGEGGAKRAETVYEPKLFWYRVSPFDIYFTPGVSEIVDADVIEISRLTRADLNDLLGVPGYDEEKIRAALTDYGATGLREWLDPTDSVRATGENREDPLWNRSGMIDCLEFHGNIQGKMLLDWGLSEDEVPDEDRDYFVQAWVVGRYTIKVQIHPSPRKRHPYYITSFEKVPGTVVGNALPDILTDIQDVCNATLRTLVNNMAMSSGPQVMINDDRLAPSDNNDELFPWKRWHYVSDPFQSGSTLSVPPIGFFQPQSNVQELLVTYEKFTQIADELSAIPRYITGSERVGGAGRTASGLAMLMGNANKMMQMVASNIDNDLIEPCIQGCYDLIMLTDQAGMFRGDERIRVRGVEVAVQRETNRQRQMEFLQTTLNPVDQQIMGVEGRATVLGSVAEEIGLKGKKIVPTPEELKAKMLAQQKAAEQQMAMAQAQNVRENGERSLTTSGNQGTPPAPTNTDLGVQEAAAMRGMT